MGNCCVTPRDETDDIELKAVKLMKDFSLEGQRQIVKVVDVRSYDNIRVVMRHRGELTQFRACMTLDYMDIQRTERNHTNKYQERSEQISARDSLMAKIGDDLLYAICGPFDKYGRLIVTLYAMNGNELGENINVWLIQNGYDISFDDTERRFHI